MTTYRIEDVIEAGIEERLERVYTSEPGYVTAFDPATRRATVQPGSKQADYREDGTRFAYAKPAMQNVRVVYPAGRMKFRLEVGDSVMLLFTHCAIDNYREDDPRPRDVPSDRRFHITDVVCLPGFLTTPGEEPGEGEVILDWETVKLGTTGLFASRSPVIRKSDLETLSTLLTGVSAALTLSGNAPGAAAIDGLQGAIDAMLNLVSGNVEAT